MRAARASLRVLRLAVAASLVLAVPTAGTTRTEPVAVVVSADWPGRDRIDLRTLRRLFLGRQISVDGRRVSVYQRADGSAVREGFERAVLRRSARELERYWIEQALRGGALPPRERGSGEALVAALRAGEAAIGYLGQRELEATGTVGLRVLAIVSGDGVLRPGEPGYPILYRVAVPREETGG